MTQFTGKQEIAEGQLFSLAKSENSDRCPSNGVKTTAFHHNSNDYDRTLLPTIRNKLENNKKRLSSIKCNQLLIVRKRTSTMTILSVATIFLLVFLGGSSLKSNQVEALNCYHCSSVDNPGCDESFSGRENFTETDCEKHIGKPAKVCRKIVQYIEQKKVVIRSCGHIDDHSEKDRKPMCYKRSGTFALMMESCICFEDNCNHSASLVPSHFSMIMLIASASMATLLLSWNLKFVAAHKSSY